MKIAYFLPLIFIGCSPQNYEDCVLKEIKEVTANEAVNAIKQACYAKFPKPKETESYGELISILESRWNTDFEHGKNVEINGVEYSHTVKLTNRNDIAVENITIGYALSDDCSNDKLQYSELILCKGELPANSTKILECNTSIPPNSQLCVVTLNYDIWHDDTTEKSEATPKPSIWQTIKEML